MLLTLLTLLIRSILLLRVASRSLHCLCFLTGFSLLVLPLTYFYIPKSAREHLFPQSVKQKYFCGDLSLSLSLYIDIYI